jgi:hypothetical protein
VTEFTKRKGNAKLHRALLFAATGEMRKPESRLGAWGQSIAGRHRKGGQKKAVGAIARRIAVGLWHVHRLAKPFDLSLYHFGEPPAVVDAPASAIGLAPRAASLLPDGLLTASDVVGAFWRGELAHVKGFGEGAMRKTSEWIKSHRAVRAGPRQYPLKPELTYEPKKRRRPSVARGGRGEEAPGGKPGRQDAVLRHTVRKDEAEHLPGGQVVGRARPGRNTKRGGSD